MTDYSYGELMKMQNEALERARNMEKRARESVGLSQNKGENMEDVQKNNRENSNSRILKTQPNRVPMPKDYLDEIKAYARKSGYKIDGDSDFQLDKTSIAGSVSQSVPLKAGQNGDSLSRIFGGEGMNMLKNLNLDSDKALLLSLIMLLSKENADETLILSLIYMLT